MIELGNHPDDLYMTCREWIEQKEHEKKTDLEHLKKKCLHDLEQNGKEVEKCLNRTVKKIQAIQSELEALEELSCWIRLLPFPDEMQH